MLVSAFGSGVDQNQFLLDGMNITATDNGVARADPGVDFIQELQIQSVGASVEYGNVQGAVVNVITKSGSNRFLYESRPTTAQTASLTSQPVRRLYTTAATSQSGYERATYRDFTTTLGGPVVRDRLWFFSGYQHLRDYDSQPGTDPELPEEIRAGQDLREAHLAPGSGAGSWCRVFTTSSGPTPRSPTSDEAARRDPVRRRDRCRR